MKFKYIVFPPKGEYDGWRTWHQAMATGVFSAAALIIFTEFIKYLL